MSHNGQELTVCVVSGPTLAGKSYLLNWLLGLPKYKNSFLIEMDKVRQVLFGNRKLTDTEHVFKNETTLCCLKKCLVIERPDIVFMEMGLPTEDRHQIPLIATIADAQRYVDRIETERGLETRQESNGFKINLRVILTYCDIESVKRRISYRLNKPDDKSYTDVFCIETYLRDMSLLFEVPRIYKPLPINTSDESETAVKAHRQEVLFFIAGGWPFNHATWTARIDEYKDIIDQASKMYEASINF